MSAISGWRSVMPVSDEYTRVGMVDDVHVDRHPLVLGQQVGNGGWR
jgi:hypothetical protein